MICGEIVNSAQRAIECEARLVSRLASERKRFENWLQLQVLRDFLAQGYPLEIEHPYPEGKDRCDFWAKSDSLESWVELKLCVTNYCSSFTGAVSSRPITNQISSIILDIEKLGQIDAQHSRSIVLLAYPLPLGNEEHPAWEKHLSTIGERAETITRNFQVQLNHASKEASISAYTISL